MRHARQMHASCLDSCSNGVQFFISHVPRCFCTRRFSEPTFRPSGATKIGKNRVSRLSYIFAHLHLPLFWLSPRPSSSWLCFFLALFFLSTLSELQFLNSFRYMVIFHRYVRLREGTLFRIEGCSLIPSFFFWVSLLCIGPLWPCVRCGLPLCSSSIFFHIKQYSR